MAEDDVAAAAESFLGDVERAPDSPIVLSRYGFKK